ncbi:recombinase family protein [Halomarina ordinaria]|uniref:Recombinase family protein n=1 Tax=Halomarina ordinaria TaxID=3033939 RepID=A0ABD5UHM8_9EURY|nr:recombinase family protein [Halomarina sp. PSRA2]
MSAEPSQMPSAVDHQAAISDYSDTPVGRTLNTPDSATNQYQSVGDESVSSITVTELGELLEKKEMDRPLRALIYVRVSTLRQVTDGESLERQLQNLRKLAREQGYEVVFEIVDDGETGTDFRRAGIRRVLKLARSGKFDVLVVNDVSRIGRNAPETLYLLHLLNNEGIRVNMEREEVNIGECIDDLITTTLKSLSAHVSTETRVTNSLKTVIHKFENQRNWWSVFNTVPLGYQAEKGDDQ